MSQHDMTVDNGAGVAVRADINLALKALASQSSGASAPSPTFPAQVWADTGTGRLKQRDAANANWVDKGPIDGAMAPLDSPLFTGQPAGPLPCVVGQVRNAKMSITAASATGTLTADEVIVKSALGGNSYRLPSFSKTINLGATGAGGMDIGSSPASGWVALYAIYNPTTGTSALLAKNATAGVQTEVYSGANMPSGYTASALVSVWPTTGAGQLAVGSQFDRVVSTPGVSVLSTSTQQASFTSLSISAAVPPNAKFAAGYMRIGSNSAGDYLGQLSSSASALGTVLIGGGYTNASGYFNLALITAQNIWYAATVTVGTMNASIVISSYTF